MDPASESDTLSAPRPNGHGEEAGRSLIPLPRVFVAIAGLSLVTLGFVRLLGREPLPTSVASWALGAQAAIALGLALAYQRPAEGLLRIASTSGLVLLGLSTAALGWFFGPNAGFIAFVAIAVMLNAVLSGGSSRKFPALAGWLTYASLALGQAAVLMLVVTRTIPDVSLTAVIVPGHPMWHHVAAHAALQAVMFAGFLYGRAFQRRYAALARDVREAVRANVRRLALLEEARAEYKQTLDVARHGVFSGRRVGGFQLRRLLGRRRGTEVYDAVGSEGTRVEVRVEHRDGHVIAEATEITEIVGDAERPAETRAEDGLAARIWARGALEAEELVLLARELARALDELHGRGMMRGILTPRDVVQREGRWQLRTASAGSSPQDPDVLRYLAPERIAGATVDARGDVYALCAVLYEAASGRAPFADVPAAELAAAVLREPAVRSDELAHVPGGVERVLAHGLEKRADARPASVRAVADELAAALDGAAEVSVGTRALEVDIDEIDLGGVSTLLPEDRPRPEPTPSYERSSRSSMAPDEVWAEAYRGKMRSFHVGITVLCAGGALVLAPIARNRAPFVFALACMAGMVAAAWLHRWLSLRAAATGARRAPYWPWAIIASLSVGPAYSLGLHSAFAAVLAVWLFSGGVFSTQRNDRERDERALVQVSVIAAHSLLFALIAFEVVPDDGNVPVFGPGAPRWEAAVLHALLMSLYLAAIVAGRVVDKRHDALSKQAEVAARAAARQETLLRAARSELDALSAEGGIFEDLVIGRFDVGRLIGRGGMGEVYEATDRETAERVALKVIRGDRVANPHVLRLFLREAEALSRVQSPYVARVLEVRGLDDDLPYIVMELVDGEPLSAVLRERDRLRLSEVRDLVRDVTRGLADVHRADLLHCDVKPHNVIATGRAWTWKLVDFGLAQRIETGEAARGVFAGTPGYMAPEQALGEPIDARADLFSLCVVVYRALTGRPAFTRRDPRAAAEQARGAGPPDPRHFADMPDDLALVLRIGLAGEPTERFTSASELAAAFERAFDGALDPSTRQRGLDFVRRHPYR